MPGPRTLFGLLGLGRFGRLVTEVLSPHGSLCAHDPFPPSPPPPGVRLVSFEEACNARILILAVPIREIRHVLQQVSPHLRKPVLVLDTASVKRMPAQWMERHLPPWADLLPTHPLFGPDSAEDGIEGLKIAVCPLRLRHRRVVDRFLCRLGLEVILTTPDQHDRNLARTQAVVQFLGRALERMGAEPRDLDTSGHRRLLEILHYVRRDTWELFVDMQSFNPYAPKIREDLLETLEAIHKEVGELSAEEN